jgi:hypothetical protein
VLILLGQLAALLWVFVLPGVLLGIHLRMDQALWVRALVGITTVALSVPIASFSLAWALGMNIQPVLPIALASLLNLIGAFTTWKRRRCPSTRTGPR